MILILSYSIKGRKITTLGSKLAEQKQFTGSKDHLKKQLLFPDQPKKKKFITEMITNYLLASSVVMKPITDSSWV